MKPNHLLSALPIGLRTPLIEAFSEICRNYAERRWEPSELNGGKLSEVVFAIVDGMLSGTYPNKPAKPKNMLLACRDLEGQPANPSRVGDRSLRILIPRMLVALYEIRNNRGVGHVGGDVDPNFMDATVVQAMARWIVAELIRVFHQVSTAEAQTAVDALVERKLPIVWERDGTRRVLAPELGHRDQTLILLYCEPNWLTVADLLVWTEYSNSTQYKTKVLGCLHKERLAEFDKKNGRACITPSGIRDVETRIIQALSSEYV